MQIRLDVVDLLQLQEVWSKRPIITAFTRLEPRPAPVSGLIDFNVDELMPRLARLRHSEVWQIKDANRDRDPARLPLSDLSEAYLTEMYPEAPSAADQRQFLFSSAYNRFVVAHYRGMVEQTSQLLKTLSQVRDIPPDRCLSRDFLPLEGSPEWIPATITDEIRSLDGRYDATEPGTPATYVIADDFWTLFVKAVSTDYDAVVRLERAEPDAEAPDVLHKALNSLGEVAYTWNRSPSVVGLCYQTAD